MIYLKYLKYIILHKYFVFIECCKLGIPFRGLVHDLSKFLPNEFIAYARFFKGVYEGDRPSWVKEDYRLAWLHHQRRNKHHWQYWVPFKGEFPGAFSMPLKYRKEMLADWKGAGKAQGHCGKYECRDWYLDNRAKMILHPKTRYWIEMILIFGENPRNLK
jgi:hypothetical protein